MALMSDYQQRQMRETELARFDRWFVETGVDTGYRGRDGRLRPVRTDEVACWRADVEAHVDAMIAGLPAKFWWAVGSLFVVVLGGGWLLDQLAIPQHMHVPAIGLAVFIVEAGHLGIEAWDYLTGWQRRRDAIESAVASRAPLPIDPARVGSGRNWFQVASVAVVLPVIGLMLASHLDEGLIGRVDWRLVYAVVPLAWGLHVIGRRHDRRIRRLRR